MRSISILWFLWSTALASSLAAGTIIDTTASWDGTTSQVVGPNINGADDTFGEQFVVPLNDHFLQNFSFYVRPLAAAGGTKSFTAVVTAYNAGLPGPVLYQSDIETITGTAFELMTFDTGGLDLTAGASYAILFTTRGLDPHLVGPQVGAMGYPTDAYPAGHTVFDANGNHYADPWTSPFANTNSDFAFVANFSSTQSDSGTPEPATGILIGGGLARLVLARRLKRLP